MPRRGSQVIYFNNCCTASNVANNELAIRGCVVQWPQVISGDIFNLNLNIDLDSNVFVNQIQQNLWKPDSHKSRPLKSQNNITLNFIGKWKQFTSSAALTNFVLLQFLHCLLLYLFHTNFNKKRNDLGRNQIRRFNKSSLHMFEVHYSKSLFIDWSATIFLHDKETCNIYYYKLEMKKKSSLLLFVCYYQLKDECWSWKKWGEKERKKRLATMLHYLNLNIHYAFINT